MFRDLFINSTILISFTFIWGQVLRSSKIPKLSPLAKELASGLACGILGSTLILFTIKSVPGVYVDLRTLAAMIAAAYGGVFAAIVSSIIIAAVRMILFGVSAASLAAASNLIVLIALFYLISRIKSGSLQKWIYMLSANIIVVGMTIFLLLNGKQSEVNSIIVALQLSFAMLVAGTIVYFAIEYTLKSNSLFLQFKEQSTKDHLTGLNNIRQFDSAMNELTCRVKSNNEKLSLLLIDIDHFKNVNDTYGHTAGDAVLTQLGSVLTASCRSFDIVSRNGGEEFSVLLPDCPTNQALEVAERIRKAVKNKTFLLPDGNSIKISVSIGAATYPDTVQNLGEIFRQADEALYRAKRSGRDKVCPADGCQDVL